MEDDLNRKILLELVKDSSQPISQMAEKVGATRQTVAKKIEQFKRSGVLESFTVKLKPEPFGLTTHAFVFLREDPRAEVRRRNERTIRKIPQVSSFHRLFGRYSAILEVWARDSKELATLVKRIHALRGIRETETFIVHSTIKEKSEDPFVNVLGKTRS